MSTKYVKQVAQGLLEDYPTNPFESFRGYLHKKDPTLLPNDILTFPTINVFMPDGDKIVPRGGEKIIPQENAVVNSPMIGHFKKYKNIAGIEMEIRVWNDNTMTLTSITGTFVQGEVITGGSSGARAIVNSYVAGVITFENLTGIFTAAETVTGGTSGAHGTLSIFKGDVIEVLYNGEFVQITPNINTLQKGVSNLIPTSNIIYYFDQWIDTNLDPSLSINTNRAIFVMGLNKIRSWTGGIGVVVGVIANTSISIASGLTWSSIGFPSPANGGSNKIVINGKTYTITGGWDTNQLLTSDNTTGILDDDLVFAAIQEVDTPNNVVFDVVSSFKNYPCYGDWLLQKFYIGNNFNRPASEEITNVQAVSNDLILNNFPYTGTGSHIYRVSIDSVNPNIQETSFNGSGLNDAVWDTDSYSGTPGQTNVYNINIVGDVTMSVGATTGWVVGEVVQGATSQAEGVVVANVTFSGSHVLGIKMNTANSFQASETVTGLSSGTSATIVSTIFENWFSGNKNGVIFNTSGIFGSVPVNAIFSAGPINLPDNIVITFSNFNGHFVGDSFQLTINAGGVDTFQWQIDGAVPVATHVPITAGSPQSLSQGVSITFVNATGHSIGDFWEITVDQNIGGNNNNAYANFYFGLPRKPGEGYIGQLPANFWTMKPQEDNMYINDASGKWGYLQTTLSADLLTETIEYVPLKQKGRNKVIFPYMINYFDNNLAYITEDKNLDFIGRKELIQLPQISHLSDPVKLDFQAATFADGSMEWNALRLYITSPRELLMFCYDESVKYWQPPQLIPENGILSEVGSDLISHSNIRNVTNTLFVGTNDNGNPFPIKIRTGYNTYGDRWQTDIASMMFAEGYMDGNPHLIARAYLNVNGCSGIMESTIDPLFCRASDKAPLGYGPFGSHSFGSDEGTPVPYFQWIGIGQTQFKFFMAAMELECVSLDPIFEILSFGLNTVAAQDNNATLKKGQVKLI